MHPASKMASTSSSPKKKKARTILSFFGKSAADKELSTTDEPHQHIDNAPSLPPSSGTAPKPPPSKIKRKFQDRWLRDYSWLVYDSDKNAMSCRLCIKHKKQNAMTENGNFKTTTLIRHADVPTTKKVLNQINFRVNCRNLLTKF